ncbi:BA3454 family stress response protein [Bacillus sp. AFS088145]|nr:BA3454 family stress response protein [Bacillus sp. AFS088145]PFH91322.1 hypothetical protein COI44_01565 [Bacillus sp. AFS088145]
MLEVTVNLKYNGKNYQTNVLAKKGTSQKQILRLALEQIKKQW